MQVQCTTQSKNTVFITGSSQRQVEGRVKGFKEVLTGAAEHFEEESLPATNLGFLGTIPSPAAAVALLVHLRLFCAGHLHPFASAGFV